MTFQGSWTYSGDPSDSDLDAVRFLVGDTNEDDKQLSNEELEYLIAQNGAPARAASAAAGELGRRFAGLATRVWVGDLHIEYLDRSDAYLALAARLLVTGGAKLAMPFAGGISKSNRESHLANDDEVKPAFTIGLHDFPGNTIPTQDVNAR